MSSYPIDLLHLSTRTRNALVRANLTTPEELLALSEYELLSIRGLGPKSVAEILDCLRSWVKENSLSAGVQTSQEEENGLALDRTMEDEAEVGSEPNRQATYTLLSLPGRYVLHAAWRGSRVGVETAQYGTLFLWGESPYAPAAPSSLPDASQEADTPPAHPFCLPVSRLNDLLADLLPGLWPTSAQPAQTTMLLPADSQGPLPSPQLIRDLLAENGNDGNGGRSPHLSPWQVEGVALAPLEALRFLNDLPSPEQLAPRVAPGADLEFWSMAGKFALELLARQQFIPTLDRREEEGDVVFRAIWVPVLGSVEDLRRVELLARVMPPVCRAMGGVKQGPEDVLVARSARALLKEFLQQIVDAAVRIWAPPLLHVVTRRDNATLRAWLQALFDRQGPIALSGSRQQLSDFYAALAEWQAHITAGVEEPFRVCFRLEPPAMPDQAVEGESGQAGLMTPTDGWTLRFFLQANDDPSLLVPTSLVWREQSTALRYLDRRFDNPQEKLLEGLARAARLFPPLEVSLRSARPETCSLTTEEAYAFLREAAPLLEQSGFGVLVPAWWRKRRRQLGVRAVAQPVEGTGFLNMDALLRFRWQLALGDQVLTPEEFTHLASLKQPLVQVRGEWVELQPEQVEAAIQFWEKRVAEEDVTLREALRMGLAEEGEVDGLPVIGLETHGWVQDLLRQLQGNEPLKQLPPPAGLVGELRPYQVRGFSWLAFLSRWGIGACLADDMGLGKTVQAIALFLHNLETNGGKGAGPTLVICPTSVVGNWKREINRFAPSLRVMVHHGSERLTDDAFFAQVAETDVVVSTYALARRDEQILTQVKWRGVVLDEAQNIKNPAAKQTQAIRRLQAGYRVALTGTPVENRLMELWSIMQFLNPGYLGSQKAFHSHFARPIERYHDQQAAAQLRKLVQPFILRRVKTDPTIIRDLPDKLENKVYCTLTAEQATLYQAVVDDALRQISESEGIQRRGLVLSMLMKLKQICNHPAHFLKDGSDLDGRSGKLSRLTEMLEEVLALDERALVFTQFAEMGALLQAYLRDSFGSEVLFLYGGTPAKQRDRMIARFQEESHGPAIFVLSLKAGGLGLNLTRANHVFHFDRWWNPAVENQATDRAFRIGQTRDVWVHKFISIGTLEERIDALIESKQALAESVVGTGEGWLTELSTRQLRELVTLSREAVEE